MPKQKTHSASKKRFKVTGTGKVMRSQAFKKHILTKKSTKRKRNLRKSVEVAATNLHTIKQMIPYK
ncbi:MAG: 50S ribosomal protein L35 [Eubacteriales bacterium]|nr:50S ribosomal protein L35 [Eubacteriales bacterium]